MNVRLVSWYDEKGLGHCIAYSAEGRVIARKDSREAPRALRRAIEKKGDHRIIEELFGVGWNDIAQAGAPFKAQ
jgi:hypothetical protein